MSLVLDGTAGVTGPAGNTTTLAVHTRQVLLSGTAATYTRPANCTQILVRAKGGGAGALGSSSDGTGTNGGTGGVTTFNSVSAAGGNSGTLANGGVASSGGSGGAGTASVRIAGAAGYPRSLDFTNATSGAIMGGGGGGAGGATPRNVGIFGTGAGQAGTTNTGGGGSAGSGASTVWASLINWTKMSDTVAAKENILNLLLIPLLPHIPTQLGRGEQQAQPELLDMPVVLVVLATSSLMNITKG